MAMNMEAFRDVQGLLGTCTSRKKLQADDQTELTEVNTSRTKNQLDDRR